jgi:hypothetical protein
VPKPSSEIEKLWTRTSDTADLLRVSGFNFIDHADPARRRSSICRRLVRKARRRGVVQVHHARRRRPGQNEPEAEATLSTNPRVL